MDNRHSMKYFVTRRMFHNRPDCTPRVLDCTCPICGVECFRYPERLELMQLIRDVATSRILHVLHVCEVAK